MPIKPPATIVTTTTKMKTARTIPRKTRNIIGASPPQLICAVEAPYQQHPRRKVPEVAMTRRIVWLAALAVSVAAAAAAGAQTSAPPAGDAAVPAGPIAVLQQQLKAAGFAPGPVNG